MEAWSFHNMSTSTLCTCLCLYSVQLRQLLSEQLHDDLLDDSIATSVDGEISVVSSLQYSLSPSERVSLCGTERGRGSR